MCEHIDLDKLEKLGAAATPGTLGCFYHSDNGRQVVDAIHVQRGEAYYVLTSTDFVHLKALREAAPDLIAALRSCDSDACGTCLAIANEARDERDRLQTAWDDHHPADHGLECDRNDLLTRIEQQRAENARLRAVIAAAEKLHLAEDGEWCCEDPECGTCVNGGAHEGKACWTCSDENHVYQHPCPTIRTLRGGQ